MDLWALCFENINCDTGEIRLSREGIADNLKEDHSKVNAKCVSCIMSELEECGAISRRYENRKDREAVASSGIS